MYGLQITTSIFPTVFVEEVISVVMHVSADLNELVEIWKEAIGEDLDFEVLEQEVRNGVNYLHSYEVQGDNGDEVLWIRIHDLSKPGKLDLT